MGVFVAHTYAGDMRVDRTMGAISEGLWRCFSSVQPTPTIKSPLLAPILTLVASVLSNLVSQDLSNRDK